MLEHLICVGGTWREGRAGAMTAVSPSSGAVFASVAVSGPADVDDAVAAAGAAAPSWAALSAFDRAACCRAIAAAIDGRAEDLAHALAEDQGKPLAAEARDEVSELAEYFRMAAEDAVRLAGGAPPSTSPSRRVLTLRVPLGVVGVISPWNWPYTMGAELFAPAMAAGNAVVWVPAPTTSACCALLAEIITGAGVPAGVFSFLPGPGPVVGDAVASGLVASLARPGGNVTGLTFFQPELEAKRLELLKETVPDLMDVGLLLNPDNQMDKPVLPHVAQAAQSIGINLHQFKTREPGEFEAAFADMDAKHVRAFVVFDDAMLIGNGKAIAALALKHGLYSCGFLDYAHAGGLMAYGVDFPDLFRRAATYVDKIIKGAKPADLPVEQATRFQTILNIKTAKALGLTVPPTLLLRADEVIE